ncbi:MAG: hypothetical protein AB1393_12760 [Candidatus Edwardsbacteria bacterium]
MSHDLWIWIAALLTLAIFSFLYKENPFYRFAEHLFVGVANGYAISVMWHLVLTPRVITPLQGGNYIVIIPTLIGILYFFRFMPRLSWLVRFPIAVALGFSSGMSIPAVLQADFIKQIQGTIVYPHLFVNWQEGIWAVLVFIGVISTIFYFYFSKEHKGILKPISYIGIVFIMVGFGASFGYTVMARISLLIGRVQFLFTDWIHLIK